VAGWFTVHQVSSQTAEFIIDQRQQFLRGLRIAPFHALQHEGDFAHGLTLAQRREETSRTFTSVSKNEIQVDRLNTLKGVKTINVKPHYDRYVFPAQTDAIRAALARVG